MTTRTAHATRRMGYSNLHTGMPIYTYIHTKLIDFFFTDGGVGSKVCRQHLASATLGCFPETFSLSTKLRLSVSCLHMSPKQSRTLPAPAPALTLSAWTKVSRRAFMPHCHPGRRSVPVSLQPPCGEVTMSRASWSAGALPQAGHRISFSFFWLNTEDRTPQPRAPR